MTRLLADRWQALLPIWTDLASVQLRRGPLWRLGSETAAEAASRRSCWFCKFSFKFFQVPEPKKQDAQVQIVKFHSLFYLQSLSFYPALVYNFLSEEDSDENPLRLKVCVRLYGWSRIQNRHVVRKLQRRMKITPGIGFRVVRLLLQSSNLLSIDPGTFSDACLLGGGDSKSRVKHGSVPSANSMQVLFTCADKFAAKYFDCCSFGLSECSLPSVSCLGFACHVWASLHFACVILGYFMWIC